MLENYSISIGPFINTFNYFKNLKSSFVATPLWG